MANFHAKILTMNTQEMCQDMLRCKFCLEMYRNFSGVEDVRGGSETGDH